MSYSRLKQNFNGTQGHPSAVAAVLYSRSADKHEVTKSGSYIYYGDASQYHEWEFRTRLPAKAACDKEGLYAEAMPKVVDGLRGDAFIITKEFGSEMIWFPGDEFQEAGVDILIEAIRANMFLPTTYEAKELFRPYCKPSGNLSRQNGESVH